MVNLTQIELGTLAYVESEILAKATPLNKFVVGTAVALATPKAEKLLAQYAQMPIMKTLEIVNEDGFIDLEKLYTAAKEAYKHSGSISMYGVVFNEADIEKLYEHIKMAAQ